MPSIIIPAHNEEHSIAGLLRALAPLADGPDATEVIVACNGCTDQTVRTARAAAPWATVLDLAEPSKPAALDAGDAAATSFPRMYLDADVQIDAASARRVFATIDAGMPSAAATPAYDMTGASWVVRSYQRFWERLPANRAGLAGTNAMAVSAAGRARFQDWPRYIGDDYFLDGLFADDEKVRVAGARVVRPSSQRFFGCISRRARVHQGNMDVRQAGLRDKHAGGGAGGAKTVLQSNPGAVADLPAYLAVAFSTRALAWWRQRRGTAQTWFRDDSRS